jgi:hypothetical protein
LKEIGGNMSREISNFDDLVDSRDVIKRIEELEDDRQTLVDTVESAKEDLADATDDTSVLQTDGAEVSVLEEAVSDAIIELAEWDESEEADELKILKELAEEGEDSPDWSYGETLIRDSYFEEYAQQLAEDCGMVQSGVGWPNSCIDWAQAARELQMDYTQVEFDNVTYWIHS